MLIGVAFSSIFFTCHNDEVNLIFALIVALRVVTTIRVSGGVSSKSGSGGHGYMGYLEKWVDQMRRVLIAKMWSYR